MKCEAGIACGAPWLGVRVELGHPAEESVGERLMLACTGAQE